MNSSWIYLPRDRNWTLEEISNEHFKVTIPAVVFSVFVMTAGTIGNCLALYIFKFRYKPSNHRYFIICLAACDLFFCLFGIPFMIVELRLNYVFGFEACKVKQFLNHSVGFCSGFIVMTIAIERYLKLCKPNGTQINNNMARRMCYFVIIFGNLMALPSIFLYGQRSVQMGIQNLTVSICSYQDAYKGTVVPLIHEMFHILWFIVTVITISVCYTQIVCTIRTRNTIQNITSQCATINKLLDSADDLSCISNQPTLTNLCTFNMSTINFQSTVKAHRLAKMLFIVAAVYICSYIPSFGLILAVINKNNFLSSLNTTEAAVFVVFRRFFLINNFVNPIIYGFMDSKFREECKKLFYRKIRKS